jgi:3D (Asp-Asp-Asp) domain-containing protein
MQASPPASNARSATGAPVIFPRLPTTQATIAEPPLQRLEPPALPGENGPMLTLRATFYMVALESDYPAGEEAAFRTRDGTVLHQAAAKFVAAAALQGTAQLNDGRILIVDGREQGERRWKISPYGHAVGAMGCKLVPFRSAAVDRRLVPLGSELMIEATRGIKLPGGEVHDGVWYATDVGTDIRNNRVDLFVGVGRTPLAVPFGHGIKNLEPLKIRVGAKTHGCPA